MISRPVHSFEVVTTDNVRTYDSPGGHNATRLLPASASGRRPRVKAALPAGAGVMEPQADWQLAGQLTVALC